jgi:hypothetical protein
MSQPPVARRPAEALRSPGAGAAVRIFSVACLAWLALRFLPATPVPGMASFVSVVRVAPSPTLGVYEVVGRPEPAEDPTGVFRTPEVVAALARLEGRVDAANAELRQTAREMAGRIEPFPEEETTTLRVAGVLVPFYGADAVRLAGAREDAGTRPWLALEAMRECIDATLAEPDEGILVADAARRRELTRLLRNTEDALEGQDTAVLRAVDEFSAEALAAAASAQGPFRRHGRGRIFEVAFAAGLGAMLREALRRRPGVLPVELSLTFAPVLAAGVLFAAEGSGMVSRDPVRGMPLGFLALAFGLGFCCSAILLVASRLDRLVPREKRAPAPALTPIYRAAAPAASAAPATPAAPRPGPPPLPRAGEPPRPRQKTERELPEGRLPIHPKRWPDAR